MYTIYECVHEEARCDEPHNKNFNLYRHSSKSSTTYSWADTQFVIIETIISMIYMPQLSMYVHVIQRVLVIATLCSHLSGESCTNGIKMLDGFTKLCSNYKKGGVACQSENIQMDSFCYKQCKSSKFKSKCKQWCRKMIRYGWARRASFFLWFAGVHARNHIDPGIHALH